MEYLSQLKRLAILTGILLLANTAFSQNIISGRIMSEDREPVAGANISITGEGGSKNTFSDANGQFSIEITDNQGKDLTIEVSAGSYETYLQPLSTKDVNVALQIVMLPSLVDLQSVEITGRKRKDYNSDYSFSATKIAIRNKELPQAVATVTKELIADRQAFQLADAVKTVSNVTITGLYNHYNIRGLTQADDGQVVNGFRTRQYYFLQPITSHLERVEVIKGPSSVTFSSADPGGTVNMVTKKPLSEQRSEVSITAGSFATIRATADFTGPLNKSKTLLYRFNTAFQEANSFRDLVNNNSFLITPSISYVPNDKTALNAELIYSNSVGNLDRGQPIFDAVDDSYDPNSTPISLNPGAINDFYNTKEITIMTSFNKKFTKNFGFNAQYMKQTWDEDLQEHRADASRQAYDTGGNVLENQIAIRYAERQQNWSTDNFSAFFNFNFKIGATTSKVLVGYDATRWVRNIGGSNSSRNYLLNNGGTERFRPGRSNPDDFQQTDDGLLIPAVPHLDLTNPFNGARSTDDYVLSQIEIPANLTTSDGIYIQEQFKIGKFTALFNLRYEWFTDIFDYKGSGEQKFTNQSFIPRVGLTYEATKNISVYATYLEGFQPHTNTVSLSPTAEGFFWTASPGRFDPLESSLTEVGLKGEFFNGKLFWNFAAFDIVQKNIILGDIFEPESLTTRGKQRSRGFETDFSGYIIPNFQVVVSYGFNNAVIEEDFIEEFVGQRVGGSPQHNGNFWGRYDFKSNTLRGIGIGFGAQYVGERYTWYNPSYSSNRVLLPAYTVLDAAVYFKPNNSGILVTLKLNNLLDEVYWLGGLSPARLGPGAPRNFLLTASYSF